MESKNNILDILKEESPFSLPDGYFDNLPNTIAGRIDGLKDDSSSFSFFKNYGKWMAAASIALGFVSTVAFFAFSDKSYLKVEASAENEKNDEYRQALYSQLEDETLIEYLISEE